MKKVVAIVLVLALSLGLISPALAQTSPFHDVSPDAWYADAVAFVYEEGIMGGVGGNQFNPQGNVSRAEVTALLFRMHHGRNANANDPRDNPFTDVGDSWYAPYVTWAYINGIVNGTTAESFNPQGNVTRQEFAVMLHRYTMRMTVMGSSFGTSPQWYYFTDHDEIANWASLPLRWANYFGIIRGTSETTISPTGTATRAEAATMMMRLVGVIRELEELVADFELTVWVEETSVAQGELFRIHIEFSNHGENDHELRFMNNLFWVVFPQQDSGSMPGIHQTKIFKAGSTIQSTQNIGSRLSPGAYELRVEARFFLEREGGGVHRISIFSSPIMLTVK